METKKMSIEQMEDLLGGNCAAAIGVGIFTAACVGVATWVNPAIWLSPGTYKTVAELSVANGLFIYDSCAG